MTAAATRVSRPALSWRAQLALVGLLALALRVAYALLDANEPGITGDADWYHLVANQLADGRGFDNPIVVTPEGARATGGDAPPTAFHPPLFPALLAVPSLVGLDSWTAHEIFACVLGAGTAVVAALVGRELAGGRAGLLAGVVVAVSPTLVYTDSVLMTESLYGLLVATALLAAVVTAREPTRVNLAALGLVIGLAALTRGEGMFMVVLLALPVAIAAGGPRRRWLRRWGFVALITVLVVAPWTARNWIAFDQPVPITTGEGSVIAGANSAETYGGPAIGYHTPSGLAVGPLPANEAKASDVLREHGLEYAREHAGRVPVVVLARVLRTYGVWRPNDLVNVATYVHSQHRGYAWIAFGWALLVLVAGTAAYVVARRHVGRLWILLTPAALVALASAIGYGDARFRVAVDVSFAILAAIGIDRLLRRRRARTPA